MNSSQQIPGKGGRLAIPGFIAASVTALFAAPSPVQSFQKDAVGVTLMMSPERIKLTVSSDSIVRAVFSPAAILPQEKEFVATNRSWKSVLFKVADAGIHYTGKAIKVSRNN